MRSYVTPELYREVFIKSAGGEKVLEDLSSLFYDVESYTRNDPYHTAYIEGKRAVVRYILQKLAQLPVQGEQDGIPEEE